jgi:hemolysin activation/secretion protein
MSLDSVEYLGALTGLGLDVSGWVYPKLWDVESTYGRLSAQGRAYLPTGIIPNAMLALRAGGTKVWGQFPWFDAAFIGGEGSLRGWRAQRFAGDASLYGSAELRVYLTDFTLLIPQLFGVYGLIDVGRVWADGASPGGWHSGYGGGIWLGFLGARYLLSASFVASREGGGLYISWGFDF